MVLPLVYVHYYVLDQQCSEHVTLGNVYIIAIWYHSVVCC